jgi:hypothetical protein
MQGQVLLRWLVRRACTADVLSSRQIGMTVHALQQLDLLYVSTPTVPPLSILPVVQNLCAAADGRSQANMLHALALATAEQCSPRVTVGVQLAQTLQVLQEQLVETAGSLTAPETILAMEALLKLAPFAGEAGPLVHRRLLDEVQERSMALASVVERPVDLLGVARVVVEAATSTTFAAPLSSPSPPSLTSLHSMSSGADVALEQVLRVIQARLDTFADPDLITLVDVLTVRQPAARGLSPQTPASPSAAALCSSFGEGAPVTETVVDEVGAPAVFLDAARFLLDDVLEKAVTTVPMLSVGRLSAWLTRLVHLHLTDHPLLPAVVRALTAGARENRDFTTAQLSSVVGALALFLPAVVANVTEKQTSKELYVMAYAQMLSRLTTQLHQRPRDDVAVFAEAKEYLLPLLGSVPEAALNTYLQQAVFYDERKSVPAGGLTPHNSSLQVRVFAVLGAAFEKGAAVLLRFFRQLPPREQSHVAAFVFHWRLYMLQSPAVAQGDLYCTAAEEGEVGPDAAARIPKAVEMVGQCWSLPVAEASRKHRAVCGLVEACVSTFNAKDAVEVLNEVVVAHYTLQGEQQWQQKTRPQQQQQLSKQKSCEGEADTVPVASAEGGLADEVVRLALRERAAKERGDLMKHLLAQLQGPLRETLTDVHTAQLVRFLTSMSKMNIRARTQYNTVLLALKGRSLTSFEQIGVLGVLARHHLRSPYVLYGVVRDLPQLSKTLRSGEKARVLKYLGQAGAQRLLKAPCAKDLEAGAFFADREELSHLSTLELIFAFNGLVELRQHANAATSQVLDEMVRSVMSSPHTPTAGSRDISRHQRPAFTEVRSATTLAELVASLCRYGGPSEGVTAPLLISALQALQRRLPTSHSLFVDLTQLIWYWPCVEQYFQLPSAVWGGSVPVELDSVCEHEPELTGRPRNTFSAEEWAELTTAFHGLRATAAQLLRTRLTDIANSLQLRQNTFLWNQLACGIRFGAMPPPGSSEYERLWDHLDRKNLAPLLGNPQQLLDVMTLALYRLPENVTDTELMLDFVKKHVASLRVQDGLQVWWYASQQLSSSASSSRVLQTASQPDNSRGLVLAVRDAAKQHVLREEKAAEEKLSMMEQRLLRSLI